MNRRLILRVQGAILLLEAVLMIPALFVSVHYGGKDAPAFLKTMGILLLFGLPMWLFSKPANRNLRSREGLISVALSWIFLSAFGALPYVFSGVIPDYFSALFESVSGFTTTGATVLTVYEGQPMGIMFWRSFTLWIGGMGVLVLTLALLPQVTGRASHLIRAESPGPSLSKLVPRMGDMAKILYLIYVVLTFLQTILLIIAGLSPFDALIHSFSTAGTGGFSHYADSIAHFDSPWVQGIITVFMLFFGVNFAVFYRMFRGSFREAAKSEELRWYAGIVIVFSLLTALFIRPVSQSFGDALRYGSFQVVSIITTTGFASRDYTLWPQAAQMLLLTLMLIGSCGGSTTGGLKISRVVMLLKTGQREARHAFQPRKMQVVRFEGKAVDEQTLNRVMVFFFIYMAAILAGAFLLSLQGDFDIGTNLTAAIAAIGNVGSGLGASGPMENFAAYGWSSKLTLMVLMLLGRLEIFPILALVHPAVWKRQ